MTSEALCLGSPKNRAVQIAVCDLSDERSFVYPGNMTTSHKCFRSCLVFSRVIGWCRSPKMPNTVVHTTLFGVSCLKKK
jgi:hypothetical protein